MSSERGRERGVNVNATEAPGGSSLSALLDSFYDRDQEGKGTVIGAFRAAADHQVYPLLSESLRNNENDRVRNAAMEIYVALRGRSLPFLIALLQDANEEVRTFSAVMLGTMKDSGAVPALVRSLADPDMNVKHASAEALGKIGDSRAVEPLIDALMMDMWLQFPAAMALGDIGDTRAVKPLIALLSVSGADVAAIQALGRLAHPSALEPLAGFLENDEPSLREWALEAVVEIFSKNGPPSPPAISDKARELLIKALTVNDRPGVRKNAAVALGFLRIRDAAPVLRTLCGDEELNEAARVSLSRIEDIQ